MNGLEDKWSPKEKGKSIIKVPKVTTAVIKPPLESTNNFNLKRLLDEDFLEKLSLRLSNLKIKDSIRELVIMKYKKYLNNFLQKK